MRYYLFGLVLVLLVVLVITKYNRSGPDYQAQRSGLTETEGHREKQDARGVPPIAETEAKPEIDDIALDSVSSKKARLDEADAIRKKHEPEIQLLERDLEHEREKRKRKTKMSNYRYTNADEHEKHVAGEIQAARKLRARERELWNELSGLLSPDELLRYKYEHSYYGKIIAFYINGNLEPDQHFSKEQLIAVFRQTDARFNFMDEHFDGNPRTESDFVDDVLDGIYRPGDPEYDLWLDLIKLPWVQPDQVNGNRDAVDWRTARIQYERKHGRTRQK